MNQCNEYGAVIRREIEKVRKKFIMSKQLNKSYVFFKNLYRPGEITPPKDKHLTVVHKAIVSYILKSKKIKDVSDTISYFEWDHVKKRLKFKMKVFAFFFLPVMGYFVYVLPVRNYQDRWMEKVEKKKYGESRKDDKTFSRWF